MRRKLVLPALAACALLAVSAPAANAVSVAGVVKIVKAAIKPILDVNAGQTAAIKDVDTRVDTVVANVASLKASVDAILKAASDTIQPALVALKAGLETAGAGLTQLKDAVQGPTVAGQLGAAGTALPGSSNSATPSTLPTGTVYRQIVLSTTGAYPAGTPIGARTWVKMPDVGAPLNYSNTYVCTGVGTTGAGTAGGYTLTCSGGT